MKPGDQVAGRGEARESRVIIFPSILQHRVQPLKLTDVTKPDHRKIPVFFPRSNQH